VSTYTSIYINANFNCSCLRSYCSYGHLRWLNCRPCSKFWSMLISPSTFIIVPVYIHWWTYFGFISIFVVT
jgi:hypothetical protein